MNALKAGDVIHLHCLSTKPPKNKFAVCVCPERNWYFLINSKPWWRKDTQVEIGVNELGCLKQTSHIDTSKIMYFGPGEMTSASIKGFLRDDVKNRIKEAVNAHGILPNLQSELVAKNL